MGCGMVQITDGAKGVEPPWKKLVVGEINMHARSGTKIGGRRARGSWTIIIHDSTDSYAGKLTRQTKQVGPIVVP